MLKLLITAYNHTMDYSRYVDWGSLDIKEQLSVPAQATFTLTPGDKMFLVPPRMAYVSVFSTVVGASLFTGFVVAEPVRSYLALSAAAPSYTGGQLFEYAVSCTGDEYLLNSKAVPFIPAFVNRYQGEILTSLAEILVPGFFDTSFIADGDLVPYFQYDPAHSFSEVGKTFADASRYRLKARDKRIWYQPFGDQDLGIVYDETKRQNTFNPGDLKTTVLSVPIVNDVTVIGDAEGGNNREDYFIGDGATGNFELLHQVYKGASVVLVQETWTSKQLNLQQWFSSDPGLSFDYKAGALNVTTTPAATFPSGFSYLSLNNGVELAGGLDIQTGEVICVDYCDGILGGLYTDTAFEDDTFLGGYVLSSPNGVTTSASGAIGVHIQPTWGKEALGDPVITKANHSYVLQMIIHAPQYTRWQNVYRTLAGAEYGGREQTTKGDVTFIIQDWDIFLTTSVSGAYYSPPVTQVSVNDVDLPPFAVLALVNNHRLNVSIIATTVAAMPLGGLSAVEGPLGLIYPTGLVLPLLPPDSGGFIGEVSNIVGETGDVQPTPGLLGTDSNVLVLGSGYGTQAAQITPGNTADTLAFYTQTLPATGTRIRFQSWESQAAVSRLQVSGSIADQAALVGDDGIRSAIVPDMKPLPRTSEDCDNAALAFLDDRQNITYNGSYVATNVKPASFFEQTEADAQYWPCPGRFFPVNAPRRGIDKQLFFVSQVGTKILDAKSEFMQWQLTFGADLHLEKTLKNFVDQAPASVLTSKDKALPPVPYFTQNVTRAYLPELSQTRADVRTIGATVRIDVLDDWTGLIEVRLQNTNWGRSQIGVVTAPLLDDAAASVGYPPPQLFTVWQWNFFFQRLTGIPGPPPEVIFPNGQVTDQYTSNNYIQAMNTAMLNKGTYEDRTLVGTFYGPVIRLNRTQIDHVWYLRPVTQPNNAFGVITSRRSKVIHVNWPLKPSPPIFVGQKDTELQFDFNGDQRNIYGFELRTTCTAVTVGFPYGVGDQIVLVQKPAFSFVSLTAELRRTDFIHLTQAQDETWKFVAYFFTLAWEYSDPLEVTATGAGSSSIGGGGFFTITPVYIDGVLTAQVDLAKGFTQRVQIHKYALHSVVYTYVSQHNVNYNHYLTIANNTYAFIENGYGSNQIPLVLASMASGDPNCTVTVSGQHLTITPKTQGALISVSGSDGNFATNVAGGDVALPPLTIAKPVYVGAILAPGLEFTLLVDQDPVGGAPVPLFPNGYAPDVGDWQIDGTGDTRTTYFMTLTAGAWGLKVTPPSTGGSVT